MRYQQNAVLTSLRAQQFFDDNSAKLGAINPTAVKELGAVIEELSTLAVSQDSGARGSKGETARNRSLRVALREDHMAPIAAVAKYKLPTVPEFTALTLPPATLSAQSLVASATAMADAATPHLQTFVDNGLSTTFLDDLRAAANAVNDSIVKRGDLQGRRNGATAGLIATEKRGRAILRVLNALVLAQVRDDAQLRRQWTTARAVQQKPGRSVNAQPVASTGSQSAPTQPEQGAVAASAVTPKPASSPLASAAATSAGLVPAAA